MARRLRHEDPPQGRDHFDLKAGIEWEYGPDPWDVSGCIPDVPWNKYKQNPPPPNRLLAECGSWVVTDFGLELLGDERIKFSPGELVAKHVKGPVYWWLDMLTNAPQLDLKLFETALRKTLEIHKVAVDDDVLDKTLRTVHSLRQKRARNSRIKRNLPPRLPNLRGAVIVTVERVMNGYRDVWLRCRSPKGFPTGLVLRPLDENVPRPSDDNDVQVITAAYPTFFSPSYDGPQEVKCAARRQRNEWFLVECEKPRVA